MKRLVLLILVLICLCDCNNKQAYCTENVDYVEYSRAIELPLDADTAPYTTMIQYVDLDGCSYLSILNQIDNTIRLFDLAEKREVGKIDFSAMVDDRAIEGYTFNGEHLYLYCYKSNQLVKVDWKNKKKVYTLNIPARSNDMLPHPVTGTPYPILVDGSTVLMTGFIVLEDGNNPPERKTLLRYDENTKEYSYAINYPSIYDSGNWGGGYYFRMPFSTFGNQGQVALSFGASDSLVLYNVRTETVQMVSAKYDNNTKIRPYRKGKTRSPSSQVEKKWYMSVPSYEEIIYDKYKDCYYRIFRMPDNDYQGGRLNNKPVGIITLDSQFNKISEHILSNKELLITTNFFVSESGLWFQVASGSDNEMKFVLFDSNQLQTQMRELTHQE